MRRIGGSFSAFRRIGPLLLPWWYTTGVLKSPGTGIQSLTMTGLTSARGVNTAIVGDHASISVGFPSGVTAWSSQAWGTAYGDSTYGTGANPTDYTAGDGDNLYWEGLGDDGNTYRSTAVIRKAVATGGADLDLSFPEDSAISSTDLVQNWTANGNTLTFVSVSPALPASLSVNSSGTMTGTPNDVTADDTYTLTMRDEYGWDVTDTFTLEITVGAVNPSVTSDSYTAPSAGTAASFNVVGGYSGSDTVDAYFALGDAMTVSQAQLIAKSGGTGVDAFFSVAGVTITGGSFDFTEAIEAADLTVVTSLAAASSAAQLKYVIVERNNGGTTGVLTAGDTITSGDFVVPTFSSAEVGNVDADTVRVTFDSAMYGSTSAGDWSLTGNTISAVSFTPGNTTVDLTLGTTATGSDDYTGDLSYTGTGLKDVAANTLATFSGQNVTNNVSAGSTLNESYTTEFATASTVSIVGYSNGGGTWSRLNSVGTSSVLDNGTDAQDAVAIVTTTNQQGFFVVDAVDGTNSWAQMTYNSETIDNNKTGGGPIMCAVVGSSTITGYGAIYEADADASPTHILKLVRFNDGSETVLGSNYDLSGALETSGDDIIRIWRDASNVYVDLSRDGGSNWTNTHTVADTTYTTGKTGYTGYRGANGRGIQFTNFTSGLVT